MSDGKSPQPPGLSWMKKLKDDLFCAVTSGFATAAFFNPWDKALYLSVKERRPFLDRLNWRQPYTGTLQAVASRTLNIGFYFPLESLFHETIYRYHPTSAHVQQAFGDDSQDSGGAADPRAKDGDVVRPRAVTLFAAGYLAGITCAALSHPLTATKYAYWNGNGQGFWGSLRELYTQGGAVTLYRGFVATMARDSLFGGVYSSLRHYLIRAWGCPSKPSDGSLKEDLRSVMEKNNSEGRALLHGFVLNTVAACVAVAASSPLNYIRNMQLAAPPDAPEPRMLSVLRDLGEQVAQARGATAKATVLSRSLLLGWGTLRAAVGMGFGSLVYDFCKQGAAALG